MPRVRGHGAYKLGGDALCRGAQVFYAARREGAGDQAAQARVVRCVHEQEAAHAVGIGFPAGLGRRVLHLVGREPGMAQHRRHLGVAEGEPDRVGDAQQRRGPAEALVERVGVFAEGGLHRLEEEIVGHGRGGRGLAHDRPLAQFDTILYRLAM